MKRILHLLLALLPTFAQPRNGTYTYWPYVPDDGGVSNYAMSSSAAWFAAGFIASGSRTLSQVEVYATSITGTPASGDMRIALYSDSTGRPGTETEGINSAGAPTAGWNSVSGFTASTTAGTAYWIVVRNMAATPASNFFTIQRRTATTSTFGASISGNAGTMGGFVSAQSGDSGSNWTRSTILPLVVITWSDGTKEGFPFDGGGQACQVYSARECGLYLQTGSAPVRVSGAVGYVFKSGTPSGSVRMRLYKGAATTGRTLVATTATTSSVSTSTSYVHLSFASSVILEANTWYSLVLSETTQSDGSTNRYQMWGLRVKSDATSLMAPMLGAATQYTISTDGGSTWTNTSNEYATVAFLLDPAKPFLSVGGGFSQ